VSSYKKRKISIVIKILDQNISLCFLKMKMFKGFFYTEKKILNLENIHNNFQSQEVFLPGQAFHDKNNIN